MTKKLFLILPVLVLILGMFTACGMGGDNNANGVTDTTGNAQQRDMLGEPMNTAATDRITAEQAQQIALDYVNLKADQVSGMRVHYDVDDGIQEYDVDFFYNGLEYEFEIHAKTGKVISFETDD